MSHSTISKDTLDFRKKSSSEPDWLYSKRLQSWDSYMDSPLPDRVKHLWRYTEPDNFVLSNPAAVMKTNSPLSLGQMSNGLNAESPHSAIAYRKADATVGVMLSSELLENQVILKDLASAIKGNPDIAEQHLGRLVNTQTGKFEALNLALWHEGFLLYIPDNTVVTKPIYLDRRPLSGSTVTRLLVIVGRNAEATIIDDYAARDGLKTVDLNGAVELFAGESSRVRYVSLQRLAPGTRTYMTQRLHADRQANIYSVFGSFGSSVAKLDLGTILAGPGAESQMYGLAFGDGKQHFDHHTVHHHVSGETYSNLDVKVVLKNKAVSAYTGLIRIEEDADNSEAYQENRNLLLNHGARAESIPELEILTDQVSCSHGATVGPVDPGMIFYLQSRGFSKDEAIKAIISGFVEPTLKVVPDDLRKILMNAVTEKVEA